MKVVAIFVSILILSLSSLVTVAADKNKLMNECEAALKTKYGAESLVRLKRTKTFKGLTTLTFKVVPEGGTRTSMTCSSQSGGEVSIQ